MRRPLSVALALLLLPSTASAQIVTERLRIQGGYLTQANPPPQPRIDDIYAMAVPEVSLYWPAETASLVVNYQLTGALHSQGGASEIANRLTLASIFELSRRTTMILSAEAAQTTFSNFLIQRPAAGSTIGVYPGPSTRLLSARAIQGLTYELSPRWRFEQNSEGGVITMLAPAPPLDTFLGSVGASIEHIWLNDAVGFQGNVGYVRSLTVPPTPDQEFITVTGGPRWRHDWSRSFSTSLAAGAAAAFSPRTDDDPIVAPFGQGSALYTVNETTFDFSVATGIYPSPLTGQVIRSHQATLRGLTPLSSSRRIFLGASVGYLRGDIVDLTPANNDQTYDSVLTDVDLTWQATPYMGFLARYQFAAQYGETNAIGANPSFLRDLFLVGVQFSSRAEGGDTVPTRFPQRVDRGDGAPKK